MQQGCAMPPVSRLRALRDLERRGLVTIEWRTNKSPIVTVQFAR
jgi:DNA-binding PadR family transcriptional regulator